jgi:hypothetical protein
LTAEHPGGARGCIAICTKEIEVIETVNGDSKNRLFLLDFPVFQGKNPSVEIEASRRAATVRTGDRAETAADLLVRRGGGQLGAGPA